MSGHKVGPDYIDPGYHALATGRPAATSTRTSSARSGSCRCSCTAHAPGAADLAVVEGVMGLYDGALGRDGFASTAHVAPS